MESPIYILLAGLFFLVAGVALIIMRLRRAKKCTATTDGIVSAIISKVNTYTDYEENGQQ